jgi:hypothetical protein
MITADRKTTGHKKSKKWPKIVKYTQQKKSNKEKPGMDCTAA